MPADTLQIDFVRHIRHRSRDDMTEHQACGLHRALLPHRVVLPAGIPQTVSLSTDACFCNALKWAGLAEKAKLLFRKIGLNSRIGF
jgi:hypothetical protein